MKFLRLVIVLLLASASFSAAGCSSEPAQTTWTLAQAKKVVMASWKAVETKGGQENFSDGGQDYRIMFQPGGDYKAMYINDSTGASSLVFETTSFMLFNAWAMVQAGDLTFADTETGFSLKVPDWEVPVDVTVKDDVVDTLSYSFKGSTQLRKIAYTADEDLKKKLVELAANELG